MKQGFVLPSGSPTHLFEQALLAEQAGWDGVFLWEGGYTPDPWSILTAVAVRTERIRLGTMLTPLPWRRPWKLAAQAMTLDHLSNGRAILAVGLGAVDTGLGTYGEITDRRTRAELLDEGIDLMTALWSGEKSYAGAHHALDLTTAMYELESPVQLPRIPIWCVGAKDRERSMRRILRCDGLIPTDAGKGGQPTPDELPGMLQWLDDNGGRRPGFDVVVEGETEPGDSSTLRPYEEAGATWWLESRWTAEDPSSVTKRLEAGPLGV